MKGAASHLHQENVLRALSLHLWVLDLHSHRPPVMQHRLMDLGQRGRPQRGVVKAHEQIMDLSRVERGQSNEMPQLGERGREDGPEPVLPDAPTCMPAQHLA